MRVFTRFLILGQFFKGQLQARSAYMQVYMVCWPPAGSEVLSCNELEVSTKKLQPSTCTLLFKRCFFSWCCIVDQWFFNLFYVATHFATHFNLMTPPKFLFRHMECSCVCTIKIAITYNITMLNKESFIKFMHMAASVRDTCRIQITPQHNSFKTRITPKLATTIRYLIYKHSTFLHQTYFCC